MPYRAEGKSVLVLRNGEWVVAFRDETEMQAKRHAAALNIHVAAKEKKGK